MKKGATSTEFYLTLGNMIASVLVMVGAVRPGEQVEMGELIAMGIGGVVAIASLFAYIISRTDLKKEEMRLRNKDEKGELTTLAPQG